MGKAFLEVAFPTIILPVPQHSTFKKSKLRGEVVREMVRTYGTVELVRLSGRRWSRQAWLDGRLADRALEVLLDPLHHLQLGTCIS